MTDAREPMTIRVSTGEKALFREAAKSSALTISAWMRSVLFAEAKRIIRDANEAAVRRYIENQKGR